MTIMKVFTKSIGVIFYLFSFIWPKKNIVIFGASRGERYFDNSKALFLYYLEQGHDAYWIYTKKKPCVEKIDSSRFVKANSVRGCMLVLQAKLAFSSYGTLDFWLYRFSSRTLFVQLWHGIPLKNIFFAERKLTLMKRMQYCLEISAFDYFVVSSRLEQYVISSQTKMT